MNSEKFYNRQKTLGHDEFRRYNVNCVIQRKRYTIYHVNKNSLKFSAKSQFYFLS